MTYAHEAAHSVNTFGICTTASIVFFTLVVVYTSSQVHIIKSRPYGKL